MLMPKLYAINWPFKREQLDKTQKNLRSLMSMKGYWSFVTKEHFHIVDKAIELRKLTSPYSKDLDTNLNDELVHSLISIANFQSDFLRSLFDGLDSSCNVFDISGDGLSYAQITSIVREKFKIFGHIQVDWNLDDCSGKSEEEMLLIHNPFLGLQTNFNTIETYTNYEQNEKVHFCFYCFKNQNKKRNTDSDIDWEKEIMRSIRKGEGDKYGY